MSEKPHVALVGYGKWGKNLGRVLKSIGVLHTICDVTPNNPVNLDGVKFSSNFDQVLTNKEIRSIFVATPAPLHFQMAKSALLAGKDVFVEKPLTLSLKDAEELGQLSASKGLILMVGHVFEYNSGIQKLRELVQSKQMGKIYFIESRQVNSGIVRSSEDAIFSLAPHDVSICNFILGVMPSEVHAMTEKYLNEPISDLARLTLKYRDNTHAHILVSWLYPQKERRVVVVGEKKMAVYDDSINNKINVYDSVFENGKLVVGKPQELVFTPSEPLKEECRNFIESTVLRTEPRTGRESAINVIKILEACHRSLVQSSWIRLS